MYTQRERERERETDRQTDTQTHKYTYIHTHTHAHTHAHTHTLIYIQSKELTAGRLQIIHTYMYNIFERNM